MSPFSIAIMLNFQSSVESAHVRQQGLRCMITQFQLKIPIFFGYVLNFSGVSNFLPVFTIGTIGNETGNLLELV